MASMPLFASRARTKLDWRLRTNAPPLPAVKAVPATAATTAMSAAAASSEPAREGTAAIGVGLLLEVDRHLNAITQIEVWTMSSCSTAAASEREGMEAALVSSLSALQGHDVASAGPHAVMVRAMVHAGILKARWLLSRLCVLRGDAHASQQHAVAVMTFIRKRLEPATALLPRGPIKALTLGGRPGAHDRIERVCAYPSLWRIRGFVTDEECSHLIAKATRQRLEASELAITGYGGKSGFRTSSTAWVSTAEDPKLRGLSERVARLVGLPPHLLLDGDARDSGRVQVVRYTPGQEYGTHHDCDGLGRRYATVLCYLSDVDEGGETAFPAASDDPNEWKDLRSVDEAATRFMAKRHAAAAELKWAATGEEADSAAAANTQRDEGSAEARPGGTGVVCAPRKGDAVLFYNYDASGVIDPRAVHSAMPVIRGEKWVANAWVTLTPAELLAGIDELQKLQ
jgi:prolyl 4-hydroxylase